jgi:hypothetical protein
MGDFGVTSGDNLGTCYVYATEPVVLDVRGIRVLPNAFWELHFCTVYCLAAFA